LAFDLKVREFSFEFNGEFREFCEGFVKIVLANDVCDPRG
jgi:hypothetical protein